MKKNKDFCSRLMWAIFKAAALSILFFFLLFRLDVIRSGIRVVVGVLMPFIIGGVIAYVLKPVCNLLEGLLEKKAPRCAQVLSIVLTFVLAFLAVTVLLMLIIPSLFQSIYSIAIAIPDSLDRLSEWLTGIAGSNEILGNYIEELTGDVSQTLPSWLSSHVIPQLSALIGNVSSGMGSVITGFKNVFMGVIVAIYLLGSRKMFARQSKKLLYCLFNKKWADRILNEVRFADKMFSGFIGGRLWDSLIIGIICFVGMLILRMPYAVLVSVIVGVTNIIPFFGPFIGAIPSVLLILMESPVKAVIFIVFVIVLQQFDGNSLGPRIIGYVTGLSSFWVLFAILFFGGIFGFVGMLIGVPVFAVIYDVVRKLVNKGLAYRQAQESDEK